MTRDVDERQNFHPDKTELHQAAPPECPPKSFSQKVLSIRTKLTVLTLLLLALLTLGSSLIVIQNVDQVLYEALVKRGVSLAQSTATPAGYSILAKDHLALDDLAARIKASQEDIFYLAILDAKGGILAHSELEQTGTRFVPASGEALEQGDDFSVYRVHRTDHPTYEFQAPIVFANNRVGSIVIGIDADTLSKAEYLAHGRVIIVSLMVMLIGALGTFLLSRLITAPIERLARGVFRLTAGDHHVEVKVTSRDELGELTRSFNEMSRVIQSQRENLEGYAGNLEEAYTSTVRILAAALDARDNYTLGHSARVARLALLIGRRLGLDPVELKDLEMGCFLHDIGKIHVPDQILNKPIPLDLKEYKVITRHPEQGAEILGLAESLHQYIPIVLHHHEWFNGQGYPHGLKGEEIHLFAQIVAIADSYDAMTSSRPYRRGCTRDQAMAEIMAFRGLQFNPELVDAFVDVLEAFESDEEMMSPGAHHAAQNYPFDGSSAGTHDAERLQRRSQLEREGAPGRPYTYIH